MLENEFSNQYLDFFFLSLQDILYLELVAEKKEMLL